MDFRKEISKWGKKLVYQYLENNDYEIIKKEISYKKEKIDAIVKNANKKELVFIKVKTRSNFKYGNPIDDNTHNNLDIMQLVNYYINKNNINNLNIFIDIIEIYIQKEGYKISHNKKLL